jgi:hypothetical protein
MRITVTPAYQVRTLRQIGGSWDAEERRAEYDADDYNVLAIDEDAVVVRDVHLATAIGAQVDEEPVAGIYVEGSLDDIDYADDMLREAGLDPARYDVDYVAVYDAGTFFPRADGA